MGEELERRFSSSSRTSLPTYVVIDDAVTVRQLGKEKTIVGPFPIREVRTLEFGGRESISAWSKKRTL
jgi:hypothetical protein